MKCRFALSGCTPFCYIWSEGSLTGWEVKLLVREVLLDPYIFLFNFFLGPAGSMRWLACCS